MLRTETCLLFLLLHGLDCANIQEQNAVRKALRADLLKDYDRIVGPVSHSPRSLLELTFVLKITKLNKVDTKNQVISVNAWVFQVRCKGLTRTKLYGKNTPRRYNRRTDITETSMEATYFLVSHCIFEINAHNLVFSQQWKDPSLQWDKAKYNLHKTRFSPKEIWVPDVSLINNGDKLVHVAGGAELFNADTVVRQSGKVDWIAQASFTSTCNLRVRFWPMDDQFCTLTFSSWTYTESEIALKMDNSGLTTGHLSNNEWDILNITVKRGLLDHNNCCDANFSSVSYTIHMRRKPLFLLFYLASPAVILAALSLASFAIPAESGERIGFVTTILLAMMVFLLLLPEYLPENADELPIIGILLVITLIIITTVLLATICVLRFYHHSGKPSKLVKTLLLFNCCSKTKQNRNHEKCVHNGKSETRSKKSDVQPMELEDMENPRRPEAKDEEPTLEKDIDIQRDAPRNDENKVSWQDVSVRVDRVMFVIIIATSMIACYLVYIWR
ncbi:neuronal acetylcholine receptor subunit alpha-7 isoform X2 [Nematostella vectensis]|uniref:neuronal acetylcholine receptor subunit alpha-7 isoform X2 n=1 Tax=Nematostella vectensis TaxID=45351 RepID=UPI00138FC890|nr:neuronal acetylcholine receptor subunit alpha-7 isoform X2 [Nematostella vectensis]